MLEVEGGAIVDIASIGATTPTIGAGAYCGSKADVLRAHACPPFIDGRVDRRR